MDLFLFNYITDTRQTSCVGRNEKLHDSILGECGLPDQHPGYKLPSSAGPAVNTTQRDGIQHQPPLTGTIQHRLPDLDLFHAEGFGDIWLFYPNLPDFGWW